MTETQSVLLILKEGRGGKGREGGAGRGEKGSLNVTYIQTDIQTDRQTDRHTDIQTYRHTDPMTKWVVKELSLLKNIINSTIFYHLKRIIKNTILFL